MKSPRSRGFSLIELVITLLVLGLVLALRPDRRSNGNNEALL